MPKWFSYPLLFAVVWTTITWIVWTTNDWNMYYNIGRGPEVKFRLPWEMQFGLSAGAGVIGAAAMTGGAWLIEKGMLTLAIAKITQAVRDWYDSRPRRR